MLEAGVENHPDRFLGQVSVEFYQVCPSSVAGGDQLTVLLLSSPLMAEAHH